MEIPEDIKEKIRNLEVLTDLDGTMIDEESQYLEAFYISTFHLKHQPFSFLGKGIRACIDYVAKNDLSSFYSLFQGCPTEFLDRVQRLIHIKKEWSDSIQKKGFQKIGILSRNNERLIQGFLEQPTYNGPKIDLIIANRPKIINEVYNGEVEILVDNKNLADYINGIRYICGKEEKGIVTKSKGMHSERLKNGLYLCYRKKIF
jgi:hypothetical protein